MVMGIDSSIVNNRYVQGAAAATVLAAGLYGASKLVGTKHQEEVSHGCCDCTCDSIESCASDMDMSEVSSEAATVVDAPKTTILGMIGSFAKSALLLPFTLVKSILSAILSLFARKANV